MNTKKKYAIRKLAVGVASVSIGLFISNTPEVAQTLGSVGGGVIQAFDNGTETTSNETIKQWKPEGSVVAQGEDGVPWELYENGYLLFKPVPGKDTLTSIDRSENALAPSWKRLNNVGNGVKAIGFTDKVYLPEDSSDLFANSAGQNIGMLSAEFLDASKIDTSRVKNMYNMFNSSSFAKLDLNTWNTSNVENMKFLFGHSNIPELKIDKWDTSKVKDMSFMFYKTTELKELNIQDWNTSNVENMNSMFDYTDLTKLDLNKWNVAKVKDMYSMFANNIYLEELKISNWDTSNVEDMTGMFHETIKLKELDIVNWNTSKVKNMSYMFAVSNLEKLDLSKWNTSNVEDMQNTFASNPKLRYLDITNFDTSKVNNLERIFADSGLIKLKIGDKFAKTQLKDGLFESLDFEYIGELMTLGQKYGYKWTRLDKTTPFYTVEEWNKVFRANPEKLAGIWVREKKFREDVRKIVDEKDKEINEIELDNYTEPKDEPDGVTVDKVPIYKVQKITTTYKGDDTLDKGQQVVEKDGKIDGNKVVRVGTKPTVEVEKLPSPVRYEKDNTREKGQENITVKGKDGSKTTTTTYTVNPENGEVVPNVGKPVVVEPTETVVKVASKDKVSVEKLPSPVRYEKDNSREKGQENITVKGKDGSKTTTTTYTVNPKTGEVVETVGKPVVVEPTETVVKVASKDKVSVEKLPSPVRYEKDNTREKGQENITVKGKDGSKTTTTTYTVNPKTGEVVETVGKPVVVDPTETVVKVAAKDKVSTEKLPSPVRYEKDNTREKGQENITVKGKDGSKTTTTTYTVNPKTGEVVETVGKPVVVEATETVVKVAAKDKVSVEKLPSPVRYEKDNSREKGQENITVKGKDGSKTTTTTYTVNPKTGEVVETVGKPVVVDPTETVVKVAAKDKVSVEKLPSPVRYEKDNSREKGQENITVKGKDGSKTTTTTYTVNPKTGEVVETVGKPVVVDPTETVVKVASKDKVEVVNKKDGETVKVITSYEVNPKTGELKEVKREELLSKKGIPEVSEESTDFKGGVNPTESIVREDLPELKVALIKDGDGNVLEVIKEDEKPKDIQGYKNTGKTETDKDGHKVYVYEKVEDKQDSKTDNKEETDKPKTEEKVVDKDKEDKKEVISKKGELPNTSASMLSTVGLFSIFGLRKNRKKDKK